MYKFVFIFFTVFLFGCSVIKPAKQIIDNQNVIHKQEQKIDKAAGKIVENSQEQKKQTAILASGIQYSLSSVSNPPVQVLTARSLNERIISIIGSPFVDEANKIKTIVDLLNSEISEERIRGQVLLLRKDEEIANLQKQNTILEKKYNIEVSNINEKARMIAVNADMNKSTLDTMSGFFGLNAVFWGLKKFFISCFTWIVIFAVIFIVLRVLSTVNPIAGIAFSIFNMFGMAIVNIVKQLTPKAFELANFVSKQDYSQVRTTLVKVVDSIEELIQTQEHTKVKYTLEDALNKFSKEMDGPEKDLIKTLLKEQKWKK